MTALATEFEALTDRNDHTGATIALARAVGGVLADAYLVVLQEIADRHELAGHIAANDRAMRDAIQADLLKTAKLQEKL
jgi:hypothetical protein